MSAKLTPPPARFTARLLSPRYWPTWAGLGLLWLAVQLPLSWQWPLGRALGRAMLRATPRRRCIAETNLALCFPELSAEGHRRLLAAHFEALGIAVFETGIAWFWPVRRLKDIAEIEGLEHLRAAGRGAILLAMHLTTLEIGAALLRTEIGFDGVYKRHRNAVYDYVQLRGRSRHGDSVMIRHRDIRAALASLHGGRILWYAPDQDGGRRATVFAPFFGVPAATTTATARLAQLSGAAVIPFTQVRLPGGRGYRLTLHPALSGFPCGDAAADARYLNGFFEEQIRRQPAEYLWVHRRFKTRPAGAAPVYRQCTAR